MDRCRPRLTRRHACLLLLAVSASVYLLYSATTCGNIDGGGFVSGGSRFFRFRFGIDVQAAAEMTTTAGLQPSGQLGAAPNPPNRTPGLPDEHPRGADVSPLLDSAGPEVSTSDTPHRTPLEVVGPSHTEPWAFGAAGPQYRRETAGASRKLPQALIIGVKKGGTRALLEFIRLHPDVRAVGPEAHFFDRHYQKGLDWYRRHMPPSLEGQITMEKTPSYFVTKEVPHRVYNMSREAKLLVVVRDPVTRAISDYAQTASKRHDLRPFEELAFRNNATGLVDTSWVAIKIGVYAKHLERWLRYFPRRQLHFVSGELLIKDPAGEMAKVQDFLGIRRIITENHFYFNETKGFPCLKKSERNGSPKCLGRTKGRAHPNIDPAAVQRLRDFYRPFNAKFYLMTGINFEWP